MADFEFVEEDESAISLTPKIKVIGVGGGGCNAVNQMMDFDLEGVELICANTDMQVLSKSPIAHKLQLGAQITRGMGAGSKPEVGRAAAEEDRDRIQNVLEDADMVFIAAGMGGGTGTGAAPVIASIANKIKKENDKKILTIAIVTKPFFFEGAKRMQLAEAGLRELLKEVNGLIVIPNDRISAVMDENATLLDSFKMVDNVLRNNVYNIARMIQGGGFINIDLEDVRTAMAKRGVAMMGTGVAEGKDRARAAVEKAVSSPLLENIDLSEARGILVNIISGKNFSQNEFTIIGSVINGMTNKADETKFGWAADESMGESVSVTVIATGISSELDEEEVVFEDDAAPVAQAVLSGKKGDDFIDLDIPAILRRSR